MDLESKNRRKRREKKEKKLKLSLESSRNIIFASESSCLLIGYGGLANDVGRQDMESVLCQFLGFLDLEMPVSETYSFAKFASIETAAAAKADISGFSLLTPRLEKRQSVTLLALFVADSEWPSANVEESYLPEGLVMLDNFISESEEMAMTESLNWNTDACEHSNSLKQRRVKHFGFEFLYGSNNVDPSTPIDDKIPPVCVPVLERLLKDGYITTIPDQLTVNRYEPGQGIPPHVDTHSAFGDIIVSISCCGQTLMDFREPDSGRRGSVLLKSRSALIMSGSARYQWTHGISARKADLLSDENGKMTLIPRETRISFTFRKVLQEPKCECDFRVQCDYQRTVTTEAEANDDKSTKQPAIEDASSLEKRFVLEVYNSIADHFSSTRHSPWPRVSDFLNRLSAGSIVADVGCGNGKYLTVNRDLLLLASDFSSQLCYIADNRFSSEPCVGGVMVADILRLPYRSCSVDGVICIAVLHHLASEQRRLDGVRELARITRPGGRILITVWAFDQLAEKEENPQSSYSYVKENRQSERTELCDCSLPIHRNRTQFKEKDMLVPWHKQRKTADGKGVTLHRYYHLFGRGELNEICEGTEMLTVVDSYYDKGNWAVIAERIE